MLLGLDASNVNSDAAYAAALPGAAFMIHKATEGITFVDKKYGPRIAGARGAGKLIGAYHFGHPGSSMVAQANVFLAAAKPQIGDLLVHDLEATDTLADPHVRLGVEFDRHVHRAQFAAEHVTGAQWANIAVGACVFADTVRAAVGIDNVFYSFPAFITPMLAAANATTRARLLSMPLWIADPNHPAGHPVLPGGFTSWLLHQYGERDALDADLLNGAQSDWYAHAVGGVPPAPGPTPTPTGDEITMYLGRNTGGVDQWQIGDNNRVHVPTVADLQALTVKLGGSVNLSPTFLTGIPIAPTSAALHAQVMGETSPLVAAKDAFKAELIALAHDDPDAFAALGYTPEDIA